MAASLLFRLTSPEIAEGQTAPDWMVYDDYACGGDNRSPELHWTNPPKDTKSFVLTAFDPDAPRAQGWMHWVVLDIPADVDALPAHAGHEDGSGLPRGARSIANSYGKTGYGGPCPPKGSGPHRYVFTLYAMPTDKTAYTLSSVGKSTNDWLAARALSSTTLKVIYERR